MPGKPMLHHVKILPGKKDKNGKYLGDQIITQTERLEGHKRIRRKYASGEVMACTEEEKDSLIERGLAENAPRASFPGFKPKPKEGAK